MSPAAPTAPQWHTALGITCYYSLQIESYSCTRWGTHLPQLFLVIFQIPLYEWLPGERHKHLGILVANVPASTRRKDQGGDCCHMVYRKAVFSACRRLKVQKSRQDQTRYPRLQLYHLVRLSQQREAHQGLQIHHSPSRPLCSPYKLAYLWFVWKTL